MNDAEKLPSFVGVVMADGTEYKLTAMGGGGGDLIKNTYREVVSLDRIVGGLENVFEAHQRFPIVSFHVVCGKSDGPDDANIHTASQCVLPG